MPGIGSGVDDSGLPNDRQITALTEAVVLRDDFEIDQARANCVAAIGEAATVRVIAVAAAFELANRAMDAAAVGPTKKYARIGDEIGVPLPARFA